MALVTDSDASSTDSAYVVQLAMHWGGGGVKCVHPRVLSDVGRGAEGQVFWPLLLQDMGVRLRFLVAD